MNTMYTETEDGGLLCSKGAAALDILDIMMEEAEPEGPIKVLVSTEAVDADGDVVHQRRSKNGPGWDLEHFNKLPVLSWLHDLRRPNISGPQTQAKQEKHPTKGQGLMLTPMQLDVGDFFAMELEGKLRRNVPLEFSVGFKANKEFAQPRLVEGRRVGYHFYGQTLQEVALANRGANPETEVMSKMLEVADNAMQVEGAGAAEVQELKELIQDLDRKVAIIMTATKYNLNRDEETEEELDKVAGERRAAAKSLLVSLRAVGTAHEGN